MAPVVPYVPAQHGGRSGGNNRGDATAKKVGDRCESDGRSSFSWYRERRSSFLQRGPGQLPTPNGASSAAFSLSPRVRASEPCSTVSPHSHAFARRTSAGVAWCVRWILLAWHAGGMLAGFTAPGAVNPSRVCPEGECLQGPPLQKRSACQASKRRSCVKPSRQGGGGRRSAAVGQFTGARAATGQGSAALAPAAASAPALTPPAALAPARPVAGLDSAAWPPSAPAPARPAVDTGPPDRRPGGRRSTWGPRHRRPPPAPARVALTIHAAAPPPGPPPRRQTLAEPRRK
jgi:hypothetical protein